LTEAQLTVTATFPPSRVNDLRTVEFCGQPGWPACPFEPAVQIRWGTHATNPKSGLGFDPMPSGNVPIEPEFSLGRLTHINTTIDVDTSNVQQVGLDVSAQFRDPSGTPILLSATVPVTLKIAESLEGGPCSPCPDAVEVSFPPGVTFQNTVNGVDYIFTIERFANPVGGSLPNPHTLVTQEGDKGSVSLMGKLVDRQPPIIDAGGPYSVPEGSTVTLDGASASDPDGDSLTYGWAPADQLDNPFTLHPVYTGLDDETETLTLTATDPGGKHASDTTTVTTFNVPPALQPISGLPVAPVPVGTTVNAATSATDPGTLDTHTWTIGWGDSVTSAGTRLSVSGNHAYANAGIYRVQVDIADDDGGTDTEISGLIVVYDPAGGFVTGGGWIDSPSGAYTPNDSTDPDLTGRANFGFVAKYQKGTTVPTGNTEFQFQAGDLNFHSTSYEWLVVAGANKAIYKGSGRVNGGDGYDFLLSVVDGKKDRPDRFRIKIVHADSGTVVYDNQAGADDDATASTQIAHGNIVIHQS
jgi:hypothetical protein